MTTSVIVAIIAAALLVGAILAILNQWLTWERERRVARIRYGADVDNNGIKAERREFLALERRCSTLEEENRALRRENIVAWQRVGEIAGALQAARDLGREQERHRLAVTTARIEADTGRHKAISVGSDPQAELETNVVPILRVPAPTAELPIQRDPYATRTTNHV